MDGTATANASQMPSSVADFDADPRIHFNKLSGKWEIENDDGTEMEWDPVTRAWIPLASSH